MNAGPCAKTTGDDEGTIKGCGKSKKDAAKDAALGGAMGAGAGSAVGLDLKLTAGTMATVESRDWEHPLGSGGNWRRHGPDLRFP